MKFYFKPIGTTEHQIDGNYKTTDNIHFSRKPSLGEGDWLFLYAVGLQKLIGLSEVRSKVEDAPAVERFPYYVAANQLLPIFSDHWFNLDLNPLKLDDDFTKNTGFNVTTHKDSLSGALQKGNTYFEITPEFAGELFKAMIGACTFKYGIK